MSCKLMQILRITCRVGPAWVVGSGRDGRVGLGSAGWVGSAWICLGWVGLALASLGQHGLAWLGLG